LQVFDFIEAKFAILMVFEFFLTTAEGAQFLIKKYSDLCERRVSAVK